ncbi:hypothetical protein KSP39_PZI017603 [Platanthera zijinensis]|uniref:PWI domain-containing protein n=1 Tax=Platanthera zijinensis TaxID=2320716 RepID=A0AAP0FZX5_9ASPA
MSGGFFRGTSADQDTRFSNKQAKLLKSQKFPPELDHLVDMTKVKMDVIRPWIATRATELLGFEDEVLINFVYGLLDVKLVDGKKIQIQLTGFMEKNTSKFMKELWNLLLSAQNNVSGVPQQFLDAKEEEQRKMKEENDKISQEIQKRKERGGRDLEREKLARMEDEDANPKSYKVGTDMLSRPRDSSAQPKEERKEDEHHSLKTGNGAVKINNGERRYTDECFENSRRWRQRVEKPKKMNRNRGDIEPGNPKNGKMENRSGKTYIPGSGVGEKPRGDNTFQQRQRALWAAAMAAARRHCRGTNDVSEHSRRRREFRSDVLRIWRKKSRIPAIKPRCRLRGTLAGRPIWTPYQHRRSPPHSPTTAPLSALQHLATSLPCRIYSSPPGSTHTWPDLPNSNSIPPSTAKDSHLNHFPRRRFHLGSSYTHLRLQIFHCLGQPTTCTSPSHTEVTAMPTTVLSATTEVTPDVDYSHPSEVLSSMSDLSLVSDPPLVTPTEGEPERRIESVVLCPSPTSPLLPSTGLVSTPTTYPFSDIAPTDPFLSVGLCRSPVVIALSHITTESSEPGVNLELTMSPIHWGTTPCDGTHLEDLDPSDEFYDDPPVEPPDEPPHLSEDAIQVSRLFTSFGRRTTSRWSESSHGLLKKSWRKRRSIRRRNVREHRRGIEDHVSRLVIHGHTIRLGVQRIEKPRLDASIVTDPLISGFSGRRPWKNRQRLLIDSKNRQRGGFRWSRLLRLMIRETSKSHPLGAKVSSRWR